MRSLETSWTSIAKENISLWNVGLALSRPHPSGSNRSGDIHLKVPAPEHVVSAEESVDSSDWGRPADLSALRHRMGQVTWSDSECRGAGTMQCSWMDERPKSAMHAFPSSAIRTLAWKNMNECWILWQQDSSLLSSHHAQHCFRWENVTHLPPAPSTNCQYQRGRCTEAIKRDWTNSFLDASGVFWR